MSSHAAITVVYDAGAFITVFGWLMTVFRRPVGRRFNPVGIRLIILGVMTDLVIDAMAHWRLSGAIDAAYLAWIIWLWWNDDGGGDRMKRRLGRLRSRFQVRHPVPQGV